MQLISGDWLKSARSDLLTMEALLGRDELTAVVSFHAQQCVEKVIKAIIEEYELGGIWTFWSSFPTFRGCSVFSTSRGISPVFLESPPIWCRMTLSNLQSANGFSKRFYPYERTEVGSGLSAGYP
jgi:HEPN domain